MQIVPAYLESSNERNLPLYEGNGFRVVGAPQILSQAGFRACHIGWTARDSLYRRAGNRPWRMDRTASVPSTRIWAVRDTLKVITLTWGGT